MLWCSYQLRYLLSLGWITQCNSSLNKGIIKCSSFIIRHLDSYHVLDEKGAAQARVQGYVVRELEEKVSERMHHVVRFRCSWFAIFCLCRVTTIIYSNVYILLSFACFFLCFRGVKRLIQWTLYNSNIHGGLETVQIIESFE